MKIHFIGICTHIPPAGNQPYRVLLVAADDYVVQNAVANHTIDIPNHVSSLQVEEADLVDTDQIPDFQGSDLEPLESLPGTKVWRLNDSHFIIPSLSGSMNTSEVECLPHLQVNANVQLLQSVADGEPPAGLIRATIELTGGSMEVVRDSSEARHAVLHGPSDANWDLVVRTGSGEPRTLTLRGDASVFFSNLGEDAGCGDHDYLIHYRVTTEPFVPVEDFHAPEECTSLPLFNMVKIGRHSSAIRLSPSATLSNCSNSTYP